MSALFDFPSLLIILLLFICATTFLRHLYPNIFSTKDPNSNIDTHEGIYGLCWKASRIGERVSEYVAVACCVMAFHLLFIKE